MLERELKVILSRKQYECIKKMFIWDKVVKQQNYYYIEPENIDFDITVRVREIAGQYKLQVKLPIKKENALHIKDEYECALEMLPDSIDGELLYEKFGIKVRNRVFTYIGKLKTKRNILLAENGTEICLDQNWYLGRIDYELEIEYVDKKPDKLLSRFEQLGISFASDACGKNSRYLRKYIENSYT